MKHTALAAAIAAIGALGFMGEFEGMSSLEEVRTAVAAELIGGADCSNWNGVGCPKPSEATTKCPFTIGWGDGTQNKDYAASGKEWCGCVKSCTGIEMTKGIYKCGGGGTGQQ